MQDSPKNYCTETSSSLCLQLAALADREALLPWYDLFWGIQN